MWIIRKISPWQDQNKLYEVGNPIVYASKRKSYVDQKKIALEVEALRINPIPNYFEYWDVESSKEMIQLHNLLVKDYQFSILKFEGEVGEELILKMEDIKHGILYDERFEEDDLLIIQHYVDRYYYKIDEIKETGKYIIVVDVMTEIEYWEELKYEVFDTLEAAEASRNKLPETHLIEILET